MRRAIAKPTKSQESTRVLMKSSRGNFTWYTVVGTNAARVSNATAAQTLAPGPIYRLLNSVQARGEKHRDDIVKLCIQIPSTL